MSEEVKAEEAKTVKVKATQRGFHYWIRHPGEVFEIAEHLFSKEWMEKIESDDDFAKQQAAQTAPAVNNTGKAPTSIASAAGPSATAEPDPEAASDPSLLAPTSKVPPT